MSEQTWRVVWHQPGQLPDWWQFRVWDEGSEVWTLDARTGEPTASDACYEQLIKSDSEEPWVEIRGWKQGVGFSEWSGLRPVPDAPTVALLTVGASLLALLYRRGLERRMARSQK